MNTVVVPVPRPRLWSGALLTVVLGASAIMTIVFGIRQTSGLFVTAITYERAWPLATFSFAFALQNLVWGLAQPFASALSEKWSAARVVLGGALLYAAGLALTAFSHRPAAAILGAGILMGVGMSCTSYGVVLGVVGRAVPERRRSAVLGLTSAGGSLGAVALVPVAGALIEHHGVDFALYALACIAMVMAPLAATMAERGAPGAAAPTAEPGGVSLGAALKEAARHRGFLLLTLGFFVCGFQLAFIAAHLPGYLVACHMPPAAGAMALTLFGAFNVVGSWLCGVAGGRFRPKYVLAWIYVIRAAAVVLFVLAPKTDLSVALFAATVGLVALGTVPLTSVVVSGIFGPRFMGTLFGVVFLNHQIGAFLGAWTGGYLFDLTGSYDVVWAATAVAGILAALLHIPIADRRIGHVPA